MLIRCGKCGKMYDYEKCSGICPKCARYNRPDSREEMEQDMHERYDTKRDPRQHDWYRAGAEDFGQRIDHTSYQNTYSHQERTDSRRTGERKKRKAPVVAIVLIVIAVAVAVVIAAGATLFSTIRNEIQDQFTDGWDTDYDNWAQEEEQIEPEYQNRIYVEYSWADYVGDSMKDIDWDDYYVDVTTTEQKELESLTPQDGYVYYIVSLDIQNNLSDTYDLSQVSGEDLSVWSEDEDGTETYYTVEKVFTVTYPEIESEDSGYVDLLVSVPEDLEELYGTCVLNDNGEEFDCYLYQDDDDDDL